MMSNSPSNHRAVTRINTVWAILMVATLTTFWMGESGWSTRAGMGAVLLMFALALVKGLLVMLEFMELRHAPLLWRALMIGWLMLILTLIVSVYAVATTMQH